MRTFRSVPIAALVLLLAVHSASAAAPVKLPSEAELDAVVSSYFKSDRPGAAVLVVRDGKPLLRKGYGLADVELGVKMQPDHILRIGSITKQFTSVAHPDAQGSELQPSLPSDLGFANSWVPDRGDSEPATQVSSDSRPTEERVASASHQMSLGRSPAASHELVLELKL